MYLVSHRSLQDTAFEQKPIPLNIGHTVSSLKFQSALVLAAYAAIPYIRSAMP